MPTHPRTDLLAHGSTGTGDPPVLLIHGWATRRSLFVALQPALAATHRVIAVDLHGHGDNPPADPHTSVETHADDLVHLITTLALDRPIIIGHSLGGLITLELAARLPVRAAIILESPVAAPPAMAAAIAPALARLETAAWQTTAVAIFTSLLGPHFDLHARDVLLAELRTLPQPLVARTLRAAVTFDSQRAAARVRCPLLYIGTAAPYADLPRFQQLCPQLVTGQLVGCGHYFPLEVPDQLIPMIRRFLALHVDHHNSPPP